MPCSCCAYNCTERYTGSTSKLSFHRFPRNERLAYIWCLATRRKNFIPNTWTRLCSKHFADDAYLPGNKVAGRFQRKLKRDAIPTIFDFDSDEGGKMYTAGRKHQKKLCDETRKSQRKKKVRKPIKSLSEDEKSNASITDRESRFDSEEEYGTFSKWVLREGEYSDDSVGVDDPSAGKSTEVDTFTQSSNTEEPETCLDYVKGMILEGQDSEDIEVEINTQSRKCTETDVLKQTIVHLSMKIEKMKALTNLLEAKEYISADAAYVLRASISE